MYRPFIRQLTGDIGRSYVFFEYKAVKHGITVFHTDAFEAQASFHRNEPFHERGEDTFVVSHFLSSLFLGEKKKLVTFS
jgi:hypothetical protein